MTLQRAFPQTGRGRPISFSPRGDAADERPALGALARAEYVHRRRREAIFQAEIFAEPAWDMLLDLYVQDHLGRMVSIHSLCIAAAVPPTTALRWIGKLVADGLVQRRKSLDDHRVVHVALTDEGRTVMEHYLRYRLRQQSAETVPTPR